MKEFLERVVLRSGLCLLLAFILFISLHTALANNDTLNIGVGKIGDIGTDPTVSNTQLPGIGGWQEYHYYTHFSPLIALDGDANIIPWLAESYEVSNDHRVVTFYLRRGVNFPDGTPMDASVLKFNLDRIIKYGWADKFGPEGIQAKLDAFRYYDYSDAPDDYTLKIHFTKGWLNVARDLASTSVYSSFISPLDVEPAWDIRGILKPNKAYNGLGPYYVDENESVPKDRITLKRRNSWRDDLEFQEPRLNKILLTYIANPQTAAIALEKGEIDYIHRYWNPPLDYIKQLEDNPNITIRFRPDARTYYIATAYWKDPFNGSDGILLRKAMCYALDRSEIVDGTFFGYAAPATDTMFLSPFLPEVPKCCHKGYDYNLEKAKQLLADAGWNDTDGDGVIDKGGKALKDLDLLITSSTDLVWMNPLALVVKSQLEKIGIQVNIRAVEWEDFKAAGKTGDYDLRFCYNLRRDSPISKQLGNFDMKGVLRNHYNNQNGTLELIANGAHLARSNEEMDTKICKVCNILYDEAGIIPLVHPVEYALMNSKVKGFEFGASYYWDNIMECWIED